MARDNTPRPRKNSKYRDLQHTGFYRSWAGMKTRCNNPNVESYDRYGGQGITYTKKWEDFSGFYEDMYTEWKTHQSKNVVSTIDRIDPKKCYNKNNCRWATKKEQANNKTNHKYLTYQGVTRNLNQWAESLNIKRSTLAQRIYVYKWSVEKALAT